MTTTAEPQASATAGWAVELFGVIYEPGDLVEIRPLIPGCEEMRFGRRWVKASDIGGSPVVRWMQSANDDGHCIYFGANPRKTQGGKAEDVALARCLFADFDGGVEAEDALARIELAGKPWPSAVVHSGNGVHLWWRLTEPITDMDAWTRCQKKLAGDIQSDSVVSDAPRLMRVPGYTNTKYEHRPTCRLIETSGEVFDVRDILPGGVPAQPLEFRTDSEPVVAGSMSRQTRRFLDEGYVFAKAGRRCTAFTAACDLKARGWKLNDAQREIMKAVPKLGLSPKEAADIPRQIASAFSRDRKPIADSTLPRQQSAVPVSATHGELPQMEVEWQPFPVELLPAAVRDYVTQTAEGMACDPTLVAIPMLAAVAAAIGNTRVISLKSDWQEPAILWAAIVAESGSLKTPAMRKALQFVNEQEREVEQRNTVAVEEYEEERVVHESRMAAWKQQSRRHGDDAGRPPAPPRKPLRTAHVVSDCTIEAVAAILADNPRGVLLERDELSGWLGGFDRYKAGGAGRVSSEVGHWLSMHNASPLRLDRKSTGRVYVDHASLSIAGGIQPDTLVQAIGHEHVGNGLLARFLLVAPPRRPKRFNTNVAGFAEVEAARQLFRTLYAIPVPDAGPVALPLSRDAETAWATWDDAHSVRQCNASGVMASMLSKIEAAAARLALIHYVCRQASDEPTLPNEVDVESVTVGIRLAEWFAREWQRVYEATIGGGPRDDHGGELLAWVDGQGGEAAVREISQRFRRYRDADVLERSIKRLVQAGRIETFSIQNDRGGPPAEWVRLPSRPGKPR